LDNKNYVSFRDESEQDRETQEQVEDEDGDSPGSKTTQGPWSGIAQASAESG
jgi:V8-like Glu-specific endopeptidase